MSSVRCLNVLRTSSDMVSRRSRFCWITFTASAVAKGRPKGSCFLSALLGNAPIVHHMPNQQKPSCSAARA